MLIDYEKFEGQLPYASGLFGVYQPLIGWYAERMKGFFRDPLRTRDGLIKYVAGKMLPDVRIGMADNRTIEVERLAIGTATPPHRVLVPAIVDCRITRRILEAINAKTPTVTADNVVWSEFLSQPAINSELQKIRRELSAPSGFAVQNEAAIENAAQRESTIAGVLSFLYAENMTTVLKGIFFPKASPPDLDQYSAFLNLFGEGLPSTSPPDIGVAKVAISPVGIIHLFRQYFFEFDSFLGPSVQHVWLSPGATVEMIEVHTRSVTTERFNEISSESIQRSEESLTVNDEISDAVQNENTHNTKLGVSAAVDGGFGNAAFSMHASVSGSFAYDTNERKAREQLHKQSRAQSSKLSTEIKRNHKTSLRTVTTTVDTSSKRYVLTNTTSSLVNYELRRKMRQVGVQLQDVGTQLCWQTYITDPGRALGVAELVHIAQPADLSNLKAPELPPEPPSEIVEMDISFPYESTTDTEEKDVTFFNGNDQELGKANDRIVWKRKYNVTPPKPGYTLNEDISVTCFHSNTCVPKAELIEAPDGKEPYWFRIRMEEVNFDDMPAVNLKVKLRWDPPPDMFKAQFEEAKNAYDEEKARLTKEAFVTAARERIRLASDIRTRDSMDLREEERIVVYRTLIGNLLNVGADLKNPKIRHILSELISALFDVDKMLYFVAPEWWQAREHSHQAIGGVDAEGNPVHRLTPEDVVGWGGLGENRDDNYYITEDSVPAKLGSSLGWLLQLDGDTMRNAFLNAPWVKAVLPIRPGMELEALKWLQNAAVEGTENLDALYSEEVPGEKAAMATALKAHLWTTSAEQARYISTFSASNVTIGDAVKYLALKILQKGAAANVLQTEGAKHFMPTDKVFDHGFDPTAVPGGFKATSSAPYDVFDQWVEVLPTDQLVAVEVHYDPITGRQIVPAA